MNKRGLTILIALVTNRTKGQKTIPKNKRNNNRSEQTEQKGNNKIIKIIPIYKTEQQKKHSFNQQSTK
jgi:hypothetical protein